MSYTVGEAWRRAFRQLRLLVAVFLFHWFWKSLPKDFKVDLAEPIMDITRWFAEEVDINV